MNAAIKKSRSTLSIDNSQFSVVYLRYSCLALNIEVEPFFHRAKCSMLNLNFQRSISALRLWKSLYDLVLNIER
jgi:hypothetical protein